MSRVGGSTDHLRTPPARSTQEVACDVLAYSYRPAPGHPMRAAYWWIDRWRKSTAYTDMTLAEQGAYRNLLDELWLRDGLLPLSDRAIAKISGDAIEWPKLREVVMARFIRTPQGYRNETHDAVSGGYKSFRDAQAEKGRKRATAAKRGPAGTFQPSQPETSRNTSQQPAKTPADEPASVSVSVSEAVTGSEKKQPCAAKPARDGYRPGFQKWWDAYRHREARGSKSTAYRYWKRDKLEGREDELIALLPRFEATKDWQRGCQPMAQTFLFGKQWETPPVAERDNGKPKQREPRTALVPAGHPCHGRKEGELWHDPENPDIKHTIGKDGFWWKREGDRQPVKQEAVIRWNQS